MADHAKYEQGCRIQGDLCVEAGVGCFKKGPADAGHGKPESQRERKPSVPSLMIETDDEAQQVKAQGKHPEKWNDGYVLAKFIGGGEQKNRGAGGKEKPKRLLNQAGNLRNCGRLLVDRFLGIEVGSWSR